MSFSLNPLPRPWGLPAVLSLLVLSLLFSGCRSANIQATLENRGDTAVRLVEVGYPNASFGVSELGPHKVYTYRFQVQGSGPMHISFTDSHGKAISVSGPDVHQGQHGNLLISITGLSHVTWQPSLSER